MKKNLVLGLMTAILSTVAYAEVKITEVSDSSLIKTTGDISTIIVENAAQFQALRIDDNNIFVQPKDLKIVAKTNVIIIDKNGSSKTYSISNTPE
jgi:hypothetical protein